MGEYQLLPRPDDDALAGLAASIRDKGVLIPVVVDEAGAIIDGHHRAMIADSLGIEYPRTVRTGLSAAEKRVLAVELNVARRHLTDAQRVQLGRLIEPDIAEVARARSQANLRQGNDTPVSPIGDTGNGKTAAAVAALVGLGSMNTYLRGKRVMKEAEEVAPDLLPKAESGEMNIKDFRREVEKRRPAPKRRPEIDPGLAAREVRRWLDSAHKTVGRLRELRARFGVAALSGPEGAVVADELDALAGEVAAYVADVRREQTAHTG
jgi:hypothetical protein